MKDGEERFTAASKIFTKITLGTVKGFSNDCETSDALRGQMEKENPNHVFVIGTLQNGVKVLRKQESIIFAKWAV